jgi:CBS domain-containing protein
MSAESSPTENGQTKSQDSGTAAPAQTASASPQNSDTAAPAQTASASPQNSDTAGAGQTEAAPGQDPIPVVAASTQVPDTERTSIEVLEVEAESIHPPPPLPISMRPKAAKDLTSAPIGVTAQLPAHVWPPKTVADLMTRKIITVGEKEPIGDLEAMMKKFRFRHLPVVEAGMKLVGLITRTDLLHAELGRMPDGTPAPKIDRDTLAEMIMNRNIVFAQLDTPIATACRVMIDQKLTCLPVVLGDHTLVGILTESDLVKLSLDLLEGKG